MIPPCAVLVKPSLFALSKFGAVIKFTWDTSVLVIQMHMLPLMEQQGHQTGEAVNDSYWFSFAKYKVKLLTTKWRWQY